MISRTISRVCTHICCSPVLDLLHVRGIIAILVGASVLDIQWLTSKRFFRYFNGHYCPVPCCGLWTNYTVYELSGDILWALPSCAVCMCACVCAYVFACMRALVRACVYVYYTMVGIDVINGLSDHWDWCSCVSNWVSSEWGGSPLTHVEADTERYQCVVFITTSYISHRCSWFFVPLSTSVAISQILSYLILVRQKQ